MKKILSIIVALFLLFTMVGCGDPDSGGNNPSSNPWYYESEIRGKNIVFYGDSITAGHSTTGFSENNSAQSKNSYPYHFTTDYGCGYRNFAVSGAKLTHSAATSNLEYVQRHDGVRKILESETSNQWADIAIIAYGTNDFTNNVVIGNPNINVQTYDQVDDFSKAINFTVFTLKQQNPDIKIIFLTPLRRTRYNAKEITTDNDILNDFTRMHLKNDFGRAIIDRAQAFAEKGYGDDIIAIDMWECFTLDEIRAGSIYTSDGLHPNNEGHRKMADYLKAQLKALEK